MIAVPPHAHRRVHFGNRHVRDDLGHGAMEVGVENGEVGYAREKLQSFAHDVNRDGRMQRRKICVALDLVNQFRSDTLVLLHGRSAANHAMPNGSRGGEVARVQRIRNQLECDRSVGQRRRLIHQLLARCILDPELAQIGADAVNRALVQLASFAVAGFVN